MLKAIQIITLIFGIATGWAVQAALFNTSNTRQLTLPQAIALALKHNTNLHTAINTRQVQRYDLLIAQNTLKPQFSISGSATYNHQDNGRIDDTIAESGSIGPSMNWTLPLGTKISAGVSYIPSIQHGNGSFKSHSTGYNISITQPLLQGFGTAVNEVTLKNAQDQQLIDNLNLHQTVQTMVSTIANDYDALVTATQSLKIAQQSLRQAQETLSHRQARLKAGQIPKLDVTQAKLDLMTQQQSLNQASQSLQTAQSTLINAIGLPSTTRLIVTPPNTPTALNPVFRHSIEQALAHNISLEIAHLQAQQDHRNILKSENQRLWNLGLTITKSRSRFNEVGSGTSELNSETVNNDTSVGLSLTVPFDRTQINQAELSDAMALQNQQIKAAQQKRTLITQVRSAINNLKSQWAQYQISQQQLKLTQLSTHAAEVKYHFGKIGAFALEQQNQTLIQAKQALIVTQMNYLRQVIAFQMLEGTLLKHWHIFIHPKREIT